MRANFKCCPRHAEVKKADRIRKESMAKKLNFDADNQVPQFCSKICVLKKVIGSGPYYILMSVVDACIEAQWAYLIEIGLVKFLMNHSALSYDSKFYIWITWKEVE